MNDGNTPAPMSFGERVRFFRDRLGMTRPLLGELCGRSGDWVKSIETGRLLMPRMPLLLHMAAILQVELPELTGEQRLATAVYTKNIHEKAESIARSIATYPLTSTDQEPVSADTLAANVSQAWMLWHGSPHQRTTIASILPRLLDDARTSARFLDGIERRRAQVALAQVYHLTQLYLAFQPFPQLVYLTGDRAMLAAQDADNPQAIAAAAWYMNHVFRDAGQQAEARIELAHQAKKLLRPTDSDEDRRLWGLLHLAIALSYAKTGRRGDAERHWDQADKAARSLDHHHPWLMFGQDMVDAYAVTMYADLTDAHTATRHADRLTVTGIPSATRRSFHIIEVARAYHLKREPIATVHLLKKAHEISPDTINYNLFARSAVQELTSNGGATVRDDARELARMLGLTPA
ncbi:helix-turn-helix domain-containing protein [Rhizohabitans arisaemae]|uniref:helix-turn-helix domain-containing protein n=1 Tax=Rhizohabitans arisaemae TaxID=2720610 RepID=UPI0024B0B36E|nr:helix-turn-helix domain-containing protein [Rhizohabitans arisaemae]